MRLVIAARKSDLARIQAYNVGEALQNAHPDLKVEYHFRESLGDINAHDPLWKMPEKGVFTEDFYQGLIQEDWDMVVHSWKDLPVEDKPETELAATLPREDARDLLLLKKSSQSKKTLRILSSSPRRAYNLQKALPELLPIPEVQLQFEPVRGNIQTRVRKLIEGSADGLIVAKAALDRMLSAQRPEFSESRNFLRQSLEILNWMVLPLSLNPTAAAQGALAIEIKRDRGEIKDLLSKIHHAPTYNSVQDERRRLKSWGGGCHQKIGISVLDRPYGRVTFAKGERDDGELIDIHQLQNSQTVKKGKCFPTSLKDAPVWFERRPVTYDRNLSDYNAHWVSKTEALPVDTRLSENSIVWTAGVKTWKNLAQRGVWVHGTADSLGEQEEEKIQVLTGSPLKWCKWTHSEGHETSASHRKTYELVPRAEVPALDEDVQNFYWMSGSAFLQALKNYPWLVNKDNWSGPGQTHSVISAEIQRKKGLGAAHIALSFEEWQKKCNP